MALPANAIELASRRSHASRQLTCPQERLIFQNAGRHLNVCEETLRTGGLHIIALNPGVGKTQFTNAYLGAMIEDDPKLL